MFHFLNGEGSGLKPHPILNDRLITSSSQIYHKFYRYTLLYDKFPLSSKENSRILHEIRKKKSLTALLFILNYFTFAVLVITFTAFFTVMSCFNISGERRLRTCSTGML